MQEYKKSRQSSKPQISDLPSVMSLKYLAFHLGAFMIESCQQRAARTIQGYGEMSLRFSTTRFF
jgi:hypothetical protein